MTRYYTLDSATNDLMSLTLPVVIDGKQRLHPTPAQAAQLGAYPRNDDEPAPTPPEGKVAIPDSWEVRDGKWVRTWRYEDAPSPMLAEYDAAMEDHLVQERVARGYTTREPDAYLASANPRWAQDARDWVAHRDAVMAYALALINGVQAGTSAQPTLSEFRAGLPRITWSYQEES